MPRAIPNRLHSAHLALAFVAVAAACAIVIGVLRPPPAIGLPDNLLKATKIATLAALVYLIACFTTAFARHCDISATAPPRNWLWISLGSDALVVLVAVAALIRGYGSRSLLAGLDMLLPAVVVTVILSIAVSIATRQNAPAPAGSTFVAMLLKVDVFALIGAMACVLLVLAICYLEFQPLPNTLVQ